VRDLAAVAAFVPGAIAGASATALVRKQAKKAVRDAMTAGEIAAARASIWPVSLGGAYPEGWSIINVERSSGSWRIWYDTMCFDVDIKTEQVSRNPGAAKDPVWQKSK
jgi:hypothetical protein